MLKNTIAILEENAERRQAMRERLQDRFPYHVEFFITAHEAIHWLSKHLNEVLVLALDHDLEPDSSMPKDDPGTGRDVAEFLAEREPLYPIIIHSTNVPASIGRVVPPLERTAKFAEHHLAQRVVLFGAAFDGVSLRHAAHGYRHIR